MALILAIVALASAAFGLYLSLLPCVGLFAAPFAYGGIVLAFLAEFVNSRTKVKSFSKSFVSVFNLFALIFSIIGCILAHEWRKAVGEFCKTFGDIRISWGGSKSAKDTSAKESIQSWQNGRWKKDVIENARKAKGSVSASDLAETCGTAELQPAVDRLIADYASLVNGLDAYAAASDEPAARKAFAASISASDLDRMRDDGAKLKAALKDLKEKASRSDASRLKALNSDEEAVGRLVLSVEDMHGVARKLLAEPPRK